MWKKKVFERDISDGILAGKLFVLDDNDECVLKEECKEEMAGCQLYINSITRNGDFPFILRAYDKIKFTDSYGSVAVADIDGTRIYRNGRYWRISYKLKNASKIK